MKVKVIRIMINAFVTALRLQTKMNVIYFGVVWWSSHMRLFIGSTGWSTMILNVIFHDRIMRRRERREYRKGKKENEKMK